MKTIVVLLAACAVVCVSCKKSTEDKLVTAPVIAMADTLARGLFTDNTSAGHHLSGKAYLLKEPGGNILIRLDEWSVVNGPNVDIVLTKTAAYSTDHIKIAHLDGTPGQVTRGSVNYTIDDLTDTDKYPYIVFWCVDYAVFFGSAKLEKQ